MDENTGQDTLHFDEPWKASVSVACIRDTALSHGARLLYANLCGYMNKERVAWPGFGRLAKDLGVHRDTIKRYVKELEATGWITVRQRYNPQTKQWSTNEYTVHGRLQKREDGSADTPTPGGTDAPTRTDAPTPGCADTPTPGGADTPTPGGMDAPTRTDTPTPTRTGAPTPGGTGAPQTIPGNNSHLTNPREDPAPARGTPASAALPRAPDADLLEATKRLYEQNIGPLTPMLLDRLKALADEEVPLAAFEYAVGEAVRCEKRSMAYILRIVERLRRDGWRIARNSRASPDDVDPGEVVLPGEAGWYDRAAPVPDVALPGET